jgi:hypothetical protein
MTKTLEDFTGADYFDSRDVQERIDELELEIETNQKNLTELDEAAAIEELTEETAELREELNILQAVKDDVDSSEWPDGMTFIRTDEFENYARELAEDIGTISKDSSWPIYHIDWAAATEELAQDYSIATLGDYDYYYFRS